MSAQSAPATALARYRPAVLFVAGIAAVYSSYLCYSTWRETSPAQRSSRPVIASLRRRNAGRLPIHGPTINAVSNGHWYPNVACEYDGRLLIFGSADAPRPRAEIIDGLGLEDTDEVDLFINSLNQSVLSLLFDHIAANGFSDRAVLGADDSETLELAFRDRRLDKLLQLAHFFTGIFWHFGATDFECAAYKWCEQDTSASDDRTVDEGDQQRLQQHPRQASSQGLKGMLYNIAEEEAKNQAYVHRGTRCDCCNMLPIKGVRWHCINCPDYDLCSNCEALGSHPLSHVFAKIQIPICTLRQPREVLHSWYPGELGSDQPSPDDHYKKEMSQGTGFEPSRVDAYWDQFLCMSKQRPGTGTSNKARDRVIDRALFHRAFTSAGSSNPLRPNYLLQRLFAFYDINQDDFIDFGEFLHGISYQMNPARRLDLRPVFNGYDQDGDGYISRGDVLRMFRAKYNMHKDMILDVVKVADEQPRAIATPTHQLLEENRPISSLFSVTELPSAEIRRPRSKTQDLWGEPEPTTDPLFGQAILPDGQTDMDLSFWHSIFNRYGRPGNLTDLHPDFQDKLHARVEARGRYTGSESYPLDDEGDRFLVPVDTRDRRPFVAKHKDLARQWQSDINAISGTDGTTEPILRDRAIEVDRADLELSDEVIYQVTEEGFNDLLDTLFLGREIIAKEVLQTAALRDRHRYAIDQIKAKHHHHLAPRTIIQKLLADIPIPESPQQSPEPTPSIPAPLSQDDVLASVRANAVPTDPVSLADMERSIRDQDLERLLESAGYSIDESQASGQDRPEQTSQGTDDQASPQQTENATSIPAAVVPLADTFGADVEGSQDLTESVQGIGSTPEPVSDLEWNDATSDQFPNHSRDALPDGATGSPERVGTHVTVPEGGNEVSTAAQTGSDAANDDIEPSDDSNSDQQGATSPDTLSRNSGMELPPLSRRRGAIDPGELRMEFDEDPASKLPPSSAQLYRWAFLEVVEEEIRRRGGPARIDMTEFMEAMDKFPQLKAVMMSWLEWGAF